MNLLTNLFKSVLTGAFFIIKNIIHTFELH